MKLYMFLLSLIASVCVADPFPPGKYMMSAPAIFSSGDKKQPSEWLCEMQATDSVHRLRFLVMGGHSFIEMEVSPRGDIVFENARIVIGTSGKILKGRGKITGDRTAYGRLTAVGGSGGFPILQRKKSEWRIRPATEQEITEKMMEGLKFVAQLLYYPKNIPSFDEIEKALPSGEGFGYSFSDKGIIMEMLREGALSFTNNQFILKNKGTDEDSVFAPISPEVIIEDIPIRSEADLNQNFFSENVETIITDKPPHEEPSVSTSKHEGPKGSQ